MQVIDEIKRSAVECESKLLDEYLLTLNEAMYDAFFDARGGAETYEDVPLSQIKSVTHRNSFRAVGMTWRNAVANLRGHNWQPNVLSYFTSSMRNLDFPPENSAGELKMARYGTRYHVLRGVHRVIAGKAWLLHNVGEKAAFSNCLVKPYSLNPHMRAFLEENKSKSFMLYDTHLHSYDGIYVGAEVPHYLLFSCSFPREVYAISGDVRRVTRFSAINPRIWYVFLWCTGFTDKSRYQRVSESWIKEALA